METESRYFEPNQSQNGHRAGCESAPIGWRQYAVLEVGPEKVKVRNNENRQSLCNIKPKEPLHRIGLAGFDCLGQGVRWSTMLVLLAGFELGNFLPRKPKGRAADDAIDLLRIARADDGTGDCGVSQCPGDSDFPR